MSSPVRGLVAALALLLLSGAITALRAQSLADVAKKEEERRKSLKESGKTYTNSDLHSVPPATATAASSAEPAKPATRTPSDADKDKKAAAKDKDPPKDKADWLA